MLVKSKKGARKREIEKIATELFRQKGYAAASMRELAQALGIEAASLYSHIKSKEDLLQGICFRMAEAFFQAQNAVKAEGMTAEAQLRAAIIAHIEVITRDTAASAVFFDEWRHLSDGFLRQFIELREDYEDIFHRMLEMGVKLGEFRSMDPRFTTLTLFSAMNVTYVWYKPDGPKTAQQIGEEMADLLLHGMIDRG